MQTLFKTASTNGRWGVEIVGPDLGDTPFAGPRQGTLRPLGRRAGFSCFEFVPGGEIFVVVGGDLEAIAGAVVVHREDLQSHEIVTLLHVAAGGLYQRFEYKRRRSVFVLVRADGSTSEPSPGILLAAGAIEAHEVPVPVPPVPAFSTAMADALRRAGVL